MDLTRIGCEGVDWIQLAQNMVQCRTRMHDNGPGVP